MKFLLILTIFIGSFVFAQQSEEEISVEGKNTVTDIYLTHLNEIRKKDWLFSVTTPLFFPGMQVTPSTFIINLGADTRLRSNVWGGINLDYYYSIFLTETMFSPGYNNIRNTSHHNISFQYLLPIYKSTADVSTNIDVVRETDEKVGITSISTQQITSFKLLVGFAQQYTRSSSDAYSKFLYKHYQNPYFVGNASTSSSAWLEQTTKMLQFGASMEKSFNTYFLAKDRDDNEYRGRKSSMISVYAHLNYDIGTEISDVHYSYRIPDDFYIDGILIEETVDMTEYVPLRKIGTTIGFEFTRFNAKTVNRLIKIGVEIGSFPGYNDGVGKSLYSKIKFVGTGLGFMSSHHYSRL